MNESSPKKMKQTMLQECLHMLQNLEYCATPEESSGWECPMCDASHIFLKHKSDCRLWDLISRVDKAVSNKENVISPQKMKCKCIPISAEGMWDLRMDPTNCSIPSHQPLELTWEQKAIKALAGCPDPSKFLQLVVAMARNIGSLNNDDGKAAFVKYGMEWLFDRDVRK